MRVSWYASPEHVLSWRCGFGALHCMIGVIHQRGTESVSWAGPFQGAFFDTTVLAWFKSPILWCLFLLSFEAALVTSRRSKQALSLGVG